MWLHPFRSKGPQRTSRIRSTLRHLSNPEVRIISIRGIQMIPSAVLANTCPRTIDLHEIWWAIRATADGTSHKTRRDIKDMPCGDRPFPLLAVPRGMQQDGPGRDIRLPPNRTEWIRGREGSAINNA
jgi:hypothetical protein